MAIEIRSPSEDELRAAMRAGEAAFGEEPREGEFERFSKMLGHDRWFAAGLALFAELPVAALAAVVGVRSVPTRPD